MNIYYSLLLMMLLSVASVGCSDNNVEWESDEVPSDKITFDVSGTLDLLHDESVVVKVLYYSHPVAILSSRFAG